MLKLNTISAVLVLLAAATLSVPATSAFAQDSGAAASTAKQAARAQRKAVRKAARADKNAQLSTLEKNGYKPGAAKQDNYPQNVQSAESKANAAKPASTAK
jgi:hypothetical protein